MPQLFNIAEYLPQRAQAAPQRAAVLCPHAPDRLGRTALSFAQLNAESDTLARGLQEVGLRPGCRTLLMVTPGLDFVVLTFALFKSGALPILIDPGMGRKNLLHCVRQVRPRALMAIPLVHALRIFLGAEAFDSVQLNVTVGRRWFWGGYTLEHLLELGQSTRPLQMPPTTRDSDAAIVFTTGSTGIPKGVVYKHGMFDAQVQMIRDEYRIQPGEVDLPAFPLFALFSTALGTTCVIPDMDPSHPAQANPKKLVDAIQQHQVTYSFGSPSIWKNVGRYCLEHDIKLPSLKRILMAGAPVKGSMLESFSEILSEEADTFIPYGATEALPVCSLRGSEVLRETWQKTRAGAGYCVGKPLPGATVRVIRPDLPTSIWDDKLILPQGQTGEIVVKGEFVTREYFEMPERTHEAKLYEMDVELVPDAEAQAKTETTAGQPTPKLVRASMARRVWHRMGDMGYFDADGRLWFCGRKAHRVLAADGTTYYSVCVEAVFDAAMPQILSAEKLDPSDFEVRAALVGIGPPGEQTPVIVVEQTDELDDAFTDLSDFPVKLTETASFVNWLAGSQFRDQIQSALTWEGAFPVDIRHNAKINREEIGRWAARQLAGKYQEAPYRGHASGSAGSH